MIHAETEEEALAQAAAHAQAMHNLKEVTPEVVAAVRAAMREE